MAVKYRYGEDVLVRRRLTRPSTSPGSSGTPLVQADITSITYTLRRLYKGKWTTVEDHDAVSLTIANVIYDTLQAWGADTTGYNFQHVIDESSLAPIADYRAIYDVLLDDGFSRQFVKSFSVVDEFDAGEQPGSSTVIVGGAPGANGADGPGYTATSTTSLAIGTGSKAFTTQAGLAYSAGARVRASSAANTSNWMEGLVTSYSGTTLAVNVTHTNGSGTLADWNLNVAGEVGEDGTSGSDGKGYLATSTSSVAIGTGIKTFTTQQQLAYVIGARVRVVNSGDSSEWMEGQVFLYTIGSGLLIVDVDLVSGSGTVATWNISLAGEPGSDTGYALIFNQTTIGSVSNTATDTTLISGTCEIPAASWSIGDDRIVEACGDYSTKSAPAGGATLSVVLGSSITLSFQLVLLSGVEDKEWRLRVRYTLVASNSVLASAELWVESTDSMPAFGRTLAAVTVDVSLVQTVAVKIDWETASADNVWRMRQCGLLHGKMAA